ncbi:MAG: cytochrome c [Ardenticatenaceae bacterium]|nr:cytochrome c [Ardenticatenaceae bacterium]HBY92431.1 cytochrome C [Chloroflexota bacterium]
MQVARISRRRLSVTKGGLFLGLLVGLLTVGTVYLAEAAPPAQSAAEGQTLFQQKCTACHTIGAGRLVGPDLKEVTTRRDRDWLVRWISGPDRMLAQKDPIATQLLQENNGVPMPNLALTQAQVASLIAYLETQAQPGASAQPAGAQPAAQPAANLLSGDALRGKALFTGVTRFQNGGPPCMACHSVAGIGALGGGALGPDLTPAFNKYGEAGLANFLATVPLPTMNAVWSRQPLAPQEQADLRVFLQQAVAQRSTQAVGQLALLAVAGAVVLLALAQLYWRRRLTAIRRPMVKRTI